jgi:hypothetical protein
MDGRNGMKKKTTRKLTLHRETLKYLDGAPLQDAAGGATIRYCNSDTSCVGSCNPYLTCPSNPC